jgi:hypothetical protein
VAKYFIAAIISFGLLNLLPIFEYGIIGGHHFQPVILALTHIATLGWITMIIFGALFQLIPVVLEVKLYSEKLAEFQFWIYLLGAAGLALSFWFFEPRPYAVISASFLNVAIIIFLINIIGTLLRVKKWNITGYYIISAVFYFSVTAVIGLLLAINLAFPDAKIDHFKYLNIHAVIAFVGWVTMIIMGVSYKLIPMFTLSHGYSLSPAKYVLALVNAGLIGASVTVNLKEPGILHNIFLMIIALGLLIYLYQIYLIIKSRVRKKLDVGMKFSTLSFGFLAVVIVLGILITFVEYYKVVNTTLIFGYLIIVGFISFLIVGQMYKIVPFLVWFHKYSDKVGIEEVPMLKDLFDERKAYWGLYLMIIGTAAVVISFLINEPVPLLISFIIMFVSSIIFIYNMTTIFRR